jgi:hypothetical protein
MRKFLSITLVLGVLLASLVSLSSASSHREAPLISQDPVADNTDLYAFVSPDRPDTVTIIANYIPLEQPAGGPNFARFGDDVLYAIHVDNDGDAKPDVSYEFRFTSKVRNGKTFLYNTGPITSLDDPDWNMRQVYSVTRVSDGDRDVLGRNLSTPPVNIGPRSTPDYASLAAQAVYDLEDGIKVFAGQRDDPFFVDLGSIFDLGGLRPFNTFHLIPLDTADGVDGVAGYNTHTIALQIPIDQLTEGGQGIIGIYANASRQRVRVLNRDGSTSSLGGWRQVSRLGNPLINEVVIPVGRKDYWNASSPKDDGQFIGKYRSPELAGLVNLLYPALPDTPTDNRGDLVAVLLTGVKLPDGSSFTFTGNKPADLLRLNTGVAPTAAVGAGDPFGVLAGDLAGFPNGRRLEDDVTDIELRAIACGYGDVLEGLLGLCNFSPNNIVGDGVNANELPFLSSFPYVATPHQGYEAIPPTDAVAFALLNP